MGWIGFDANKLEVPHMKEACVTVDRERGLILIFTLFRVAFSFILFLTENIVFHFNANQMPVIFGGIFAKACR